MYLIKNIRYVTGSELEENPPKMLCNFEVVTFSSRGLVVDESETGRR